jgi:hypothetical protein
MEEDYHQSVFRLKLTWLTQPAVSQVKVLSIRLGRLIKLVLNRLLFVSADSFQPLFLTASATTTSRSAKTAAVGPTSSNYQLAMNKSWAAVGTNMTGQGE